MLQALTLAAVAVAVAVEVQAVTPGMTGTLQRLVVHKVVAVLVEFLYMRGHNG
jgi:hypothetical protein